MHCLGGEQGRREGLSSSVQDLAAESVAVKPDLSTIKGTCENPLPAKSESLGKLLWAETSTERYHPKFTGTSCSPFLLHRGTTQSLFLCTCSYAHVFFIVIKINPGIVPESHLIQIHKNSIVPVLGYLQKRD